MARASREPRRSSSVFRTNGAAKHHAQGSIAAGLSSIRINASATTCRVRLQNRAPPRVPYRSTHCAPGILCSSVFYPAMSTTSGFILVAGASFTLRKKAGWSPPRISAICITERVSPELDAFGDHLGVLCLLRPSFFTVGPQGSLRSHRGCSPRFASYYAKTGLTDCLLASTL